MTARGVRNENALGGSPRAISGWLRDDCLRGAGDRTLTGDVQLGKLAFYQLNYARSVPTACSIEATREPLVGFAPTTARLRIECSTPELQWQRTSRNALARIRTATPFGTTPSRWRVYQFHHQGAELR